MAPLHGRLYLNLQLADREVALALSSVACDGDRLTFESTERGGVSYRFTGAVLVSGVLAERVIDAQTVLTGKLEKLRARKVVRSAEVGFHYTVGD